MTTVYRMKLLDFANLRITSRHKLMCKMMEKSSYILGVDDITDLGEGVFLVPAEPKVVVAGLEADDAGPYEVNSMCGICTCIDGRSGRFCKHQCAVFAALGQLAFPNLPSVTAEDRQQAAFLADGHTMDLDFYRSDFDVERVRVLNGREKCT
jgi:hypothetical protein